MVAMRSLSSIAQSDAEKRERSKGKCTCDYPTTRYPFPPRARAPLAKPDSAACFLLLRASAEPAARPNRAL